jgi:hypothetical protein
VTPGLAFKTNEVHSGVNSEDWLDQPRVGTNNRGIRVSEYSGWLSRSVRYEDLRVKTSSFFNFPVGLLFDRLDTRQCIERRVSPKFCSREFRGILKTVSRASIDGRSPVAASLSTQCSSH